MKATEYKTAIECIESICEKHKVLFTIHFSKPKHTTIVNCKRWSIKTMQRKFTGNDFVEVCREAVTFIYNALEKNEENESA